MEKLLACAASKRAEATARQVFCCDLQNGHNNFVEIGYFDFKFIICLGNYKLFVNKLLIAQMMNFFPFFYFKSDRRSGQKKY